MLILFLSAADVNIHVSSCSLKANTLCVHRSNTDVFIHMMITVNLTHKKSPTDLRDTNISNFLFVFFEMPNIWIVPQSEPSLGPRFITLSANHSYVLSGSKTKVWSFWGFTVHVSETTLNDPIGAVSRFTGSVAGQLADGQIWLAQVYKPP